MTSSSTSYMPPEWHPHTQIIMAWPGRASHSYWPPGNHEQLYSDITRVAQAIARFEKVTIYVTRAQADEARTILQNCSEEQAAAIQVRLVEDEDVKPWMRDIAPTFVTSQDGKCIHGVDFHFNGWGLKITLRVIVRLPAISCMISRSPSSRHPLWRRVVLLRQMAKAHY